MGFDSSSSFRRNVKYSTGDPRVRGKRLSVRHIGIGVTRLNRSFLNLWSAGPMVDGYVGL